MTKSKWFISEYFKLINPIKNNEIIFVPSTESVLLVDDDIEYILSYISQHQKPPSAIHLNSKLSKLISSGVITNKTDANTTHKSNEFLTNRAIICPTNMCNLRCNYCYSNATDNSYILESDSGKVLIDFLVKSAIKLKKDFIEVMFSGGGEPFLNESMPVVKDISSYITEQTQKYGLKAIICGMTNLTHKTETLDWLVKNMDKIRVSIDGPPEINDMQRFFKDKRPTFDTVAKNIDYVKSKGLKLNLSLVVTQYNVNSMPEIIQFLYERFNPTNCVVQPVARCGRAIKSISMELEPPDTGEYIKKFFETQKIASKLNWHIFHKHKMGLGRRLHCYCLPYEKIILTPESYISICSEVTDLKDPKSAQFFIGKIEENKLFFDDDKIEFFKSRTVVKMPGCNKCIGKFACAGGCPKKTLEEMGDIYSPCGSEFCKINNQLILNQIYRKTPQ